jgi:ribosomal protein L37AE/L43A
MVFLQQWQIHIIILQIWVFIYFKKKDNCPNCKGENVSSHVKDKTLVCEDCEWTESWSKYSPKSDIIPLINKTKDLLPQQQQIAFACSQRLSSELKYKLALNYLRTYNLKIITSAGMVNLDDMKRELCTNMALIWGIHGDFNISALIAANGLKKF